MIAGELPLALLRGRVLHLGMGIPRHGMTDSPKPIGAGRPQRVQHGFHPCAQVQVGVPDDGGRRPTGAVQTARASRGQPLDELDFPHGAHLLRAVRAVHRPRLDEHRGAHVVTAVNVGGQLVEQVPLVRYPRAAKVPEMMMGIADRDLRFQRRLLGQRKPVIASEWHDRTSEVMRVNQRLAGTKPGGPPFYLASSTSASSPPASTRAMRRCIWRPSQGRSG